MYDYFRTSPAPWYSMRNSITSIVVESGVTAIGYGAFRELTEVETVTLPESLKTIGEYAFLGCSKLLSIAIPSEVNEIGTYVFDECTALIAIDVNGNNLVYKSVNGVLFDKSGKTLIRYAAGKTNDTYVIPGNVSSVGCSAFASSNNLKNIILSKNVIAIEYRAFYNIDSITDIYYAGNSEEWESIVKGSFNAGIANADIHYCCAGRASFNPESGNITVDSIESHDNALIIKAYYKNKKMQDVKMVNVSINSASNTFAAPELSCSDADTMKIMVWKSGLTASPLFEPVELEIK